MQVFYQIKCQCIPIVCQRNLERSLKMLKFIYTALAFFSIFFAVANGDKELK